MYKTDTPVPNRLSDAIEIVLEDLEACEQDPRYKIEMTLYHVPNPEHGTCSVCFAGAVMSKTLGRTIQKNLIPCDFGPHWSAILQALDHVRCYEFEGACEKFYGIHHRLVPEAVRRLRQLNVTFYNSNPAEFKSNMESAISILREYEL